jgi:23S rRNA (adenine2030-N6)-methyltransferase
MRQNIHYRLIIAHSFNKNIVMLSYRHAFHAGNHADILKHYTLSIVLDYYNQKDKPYCVIDTHSGAGMYALNSDYSEKNMEFKTGISRLVLAHSLPVSLTKFVAMVQSFNLPEKLNLYPGSPKVSEYFLRANDQLRLFELHPSDYNILLDNFGSRKSKQTKIELQDGYAGMKACLPPSTKRGIAIIDPPYEEKQDYHRVVSAIQDGLKRFSTGTHIIWYPLLPKPEPQQMISALRELQVSNWLNVTLKVAKPSKDGFGMFGSGLFILNPPWTLPKTLQESLPYLTKVLGQDESASHSLEFEIS